MEEAMLMNVDRLVLAPAEGWYFQHAHASPVERVGRVKREVKREWTKREREREVKRERSRERERGQERERERVCVCVCACVCMCARI